MIDPEDRPATFNNLTKNLSEWDNIKVPIYREVKGYVILIYVNHQYGFADYKSMIADDMELVDKY